MIWDVFCHQRLKTQSRHVHQSEQESQRCFTPFRGNEQEQETKSQPKVSLKHTHTHTHFLKVFKQKQLFVELCLTV